MSSRAYKVFSNPAASDWVDELEDSSGWRYAERALDRVLHKYEEEDEKTADEQHPISNALAHRCLVCAELIAASLGEPHEQAPDAFDDFLEQHGEPEEDIVAKALEALEALKWSFELERQLREEDVPSGRLQDRARAKLAERLRVRLAVIEDLEERLSGE